MSYNNTRDRNDTSTGYINITWDRDSQSYKIGGTWTDGAGKKWDLGYSTSVQPAAIEDAVAIQLKGLRAAVSGKGTPKKERN